MNARSWMRSLAPTRTVLPIDLLAVGAIAAVGALVYLLGVRPEQDRQSEIETQQKAVETAEKEQAKLRADLLRVQKQVMTARSRAQQQRVMLQPVSQTNRRLAELTRITAGHGVEIQALLPQSAMKNTRYAAVPIRISGRAPWEATVALIADLHARFSDTAVTGFSVSADAQDRSKPASLMLDFVWYAGLEEGAGAKLEK